MASIVVSGDTSGAVTLSAPSVAGTTTVTLPSSTGTMALLQTPSFATTIGVGGATASASGSGISFPATQSASSNANTLDDYEEGTFTPVLSPNAGSITTQSSYGYYTKVGNSVTVLVAISIANGGTASGVGTITGLPFTSQTVTSLFSGGNRAGTASFREDGNTGNWYFGYLLSNNTQMVVSSSTNGALSYTNSNCYVASFVYRTT